MLIPQLGYGGAESAFLRVAGFLARHAHVTVALMARDYGGGGYSGAGAETDLPVVLLDDGRASGRSLPAKARRWWRMLWKLRALKREHDVTISFLSGANLLNAFAGTRRRTIVSERGSKRSDTGATRWRRLIWTNCLDSITYRCAERIVCASSGLAGEIIGGNPRVADRTVALEGTVHADVLLELADAAVDVDLDCLDGEQTVVAFGRLHHQKGYDLLLHAFAVVRRTIPAARLLLIGDGPEADSLTALARGMGLTIGVAADPQKPAVVLAGYRENPIRLLRLGRVVALPSRYEGLSNALIEALAAGIPVLASDCPWGARSVLAGPSDRMTETWPVTAPVRLTHGVLMPLPDDPTAADIWAQEIVAALQAPVTRRSRLQRQQAIARFDIENTGPRWLALAREISRHPTTSSPGERNR